MAEHPLAGAFHKLARAEEHFRALTAQTRKVGQVKGPAFRSDRDLTNDEHAFVFEEGPKIRLQLGVVIGDIVHNARSALDALVYELVISNQGKPHRVHQFPILDSPDDWTEKVASPPKNRRGMLDSVKPAHVTTIQGLQPYSPTAGKSRLAMLRDFSNTDKHRLVHTGVYGQSAAPVFSATATAPSGAQYVAQVQVLRSHPVRQPIEDGTELAAVRFDFNFPGGTTPDNLKVDVGADLKMLARFGEPGEEWATVRDFGEAVAEARAIVTSFSAAF